MTFEIYAYEFEHSAGVVDFDGIIIYSWEMLNFDEYVHNRLNSFPFFSYYLFKQLHKI